MAEHLPQGHLPSGHLPDGHLPEAADTPPVFSGTIPDIERNQNSGEYQVNLGAYFSGATSYSISPAVEAGWTFDTGTGVLAVQTTGAGEFGPYVVTGTNAAGSDDSNAFGVTVVAQSDTSGGWQFLIDFELERRRRLREAKRRRELEEETEQIQDALDREIATLLRRQEAKDERRAELNRLEALAKAHQDIDAASRYSPNVATAMRAAIEKGTTSALDRLDRELKKAMREEEEALLMNIIFLLNDG